MKVNPGESGEFSIGRAVSIGYSANFYQNMPTMNASPIPTRTVAVSSGK